MMKRIFGLGLVAFLAVQFSYGQTLQEGKNHLFAQRYELASNTFNKILETNPADIDALYWAGQTIIEKEENPAQKLALAKQWYEKAVQKTNNAPLIMVGAGEVDLLENKLDDARQKFESALTITRTKKGDNVDILSAVARANTDVKAGDAAYVVDKLAVAADKGEKNAEMYVWFGNALRKARPGEAGGEAFRNYKKALELNPSLALASYRLARLFDSQRNWELVMQYLTECLEKDPKFTAAYYELFYYYFARKDFNTAEAQLQKYIETKLPERDSQDEFLYAQLCWARLDFDCAINKALPVLKAQESMPKPRVIRLLADSYFQKGDTLEKLKDANAAVNYATAKTYSDLFFEKIPKAEAILYDYQLRANILDKTGGTSDEIYNTYLASTTIDTLASLKFELLRKGADKLKAKGDSVSRNREGDLRLKVVSMKENPSQRDYFDAGFSYFQGKNFNRADSIFDLYVTKYPDEPYGYMMEYNIHRSIDSTMELGAAIPWGLKYLAVLEKDQVKNSKTIIGVCSYLAQYYANIAKDKDKALEYLRKILALDPNNQVIQQTINTLENPPAIKPGAGGKGNPPVKQ
jgi:tetratricopeptide (TPR) repeat protein